jgi:hypothetical protein
MLYFQVSDRPLRCERILDQRQWQVPVPKATVGPGTIHRNQWALNTFEKWVAAYNEEHDKCDDDKSKMCIVELKDMDADQLNIWLPWFILGVRKDNGDEYPPKSLLAMIMGIQAYLHSEMDMPATFIHDEPVFSGIKETLDTEVRRLTEKGVGKAKSGHTFSDDDIDVLWENQGLGDFNPAVLLKTVLFYNSHHFGVKGGKEHRELRYHPSQIQLVQPSDDVPYLVYQRETRKSDQVIQRANVDHPERCHVRLYMKYMELSPKGGRDNNFYLQPLQHEKPDVWYSRQAYGHNTLNKFIKELRRFKDSSNDDEDL